MGKWKTTSDLPIDDWKKLAKLFIIKKDCFKKKSKSAFGNRKLYRVIVFNPATRDFTPHFLIKANVPGDFYHTGSYHTFGRITISELYWSLEFLSNCKDIYLVKEENMETKEVKIKIPEGYEIDKEKSTFECIKFKKKEVSWRSTETNNLNYINKISGYTIGVGSEPLEVKNWLHTKFNRFLFATEKQAKSALAMAQISQIMANDKRFGGVVTDEEWTKDSMIKYCIKRSGRYGYPEIVYKHYHFLAFHTKEQRDLFIEENEDLVKDYLMID